MSVLRELNPFLFVLRGFCDSSITVYMERNLGFEAGNLPSLLPVHGCHKVGLELVEQPVDGLLEQRVACHFHKHTPLAVAVWGAHRHFQVGLRYLVYIHARPF